MTAPCPTCGHIKPTEVAWGPLTAHDNPYRVLWRGKLVRLAPAEATVMFELVRHGQITTERILALAPHAENGGSYSLAKIRMHKIRERLRVAGVNDVVVRTDHSIGYYLAALEVR